MKVLITGGTGFLGQNLALHLNRLGYEVTISGRNEKVGMALAQKSLRFIRADLCNATQMNEAIAGMDYVFHCGALSSPWGCYSNFFASNVQGTENVIQGCLKHDIRRLIYVSSPSIYFDYHDKLNIRETDPLPRRMVNYYAQSKYLAEQYIDAAFTVGLPVITLRPRAIFGPGDTTLFPRLIIANQKHGIPLINGGHILMDLSYIENVVEALVLAMYSGEPTLGKKYNISDGTPVIFRELLGELFQKLGLNLQTRNLSFSTAYLGAFLAERFYRCFLPGQEPPFTCYTVGTISKSLTLNIDTAKNELGYTPKISTAQGVELFINWWKENNDACHH